METLKRIWNSVDLRKKILFTLFIILVFRVIAHITVPGVDLDVVRSLYEKTGQDQAHMILSALTGGGMENFSVVLMGLAPYINASIIVQLMTVVIPKLEQWKNEGESGQRRITSLTRWLTFPLALAQSYGMILLITNGNKQMGIDPTNFASVFPAMLTISAGTIFLVWLGELITEKGIGNGISLLIFTGIISSMPTVLGNILSESLGAAGTSAKLIPFLIFVIITAFLLVIVVVVTDANRPIMIVNTSRSTSGERTSLPIRVLQSGMIPIIFAVSLITFPSIIAELMTDSDSSWLQTSSQWWTNHFNQQTPTFEYLLLYFSLIVLFSYFYVSITFQPEKVAENIQKRGGFVPGLRPGTETANHLGKVSNRMNLWGGSFLGLIALVPLVFTMFTNLTSADLIISGSGLIIVVGVVLELIRQINAQLVSHNYEKLA